MADNVSYVSASESDEEVDLYMSDGSSDFEMDVATNNGVTQPYMFEPEIDDDPNVETSEADHELEIQAIRVGSNDWCTCEHCPVMPTEVESICCKEVDQVQIMMDAIQGDLPCIVLHPGFDAVCLNIYVLQTAYLTFRQYHGQLTNDENKKNRYIAYRQFVRWCWGWLGRHVRVRLPACAVSCIRTNFPAPDGQYNGFEFE